AVLGKAITSRRELAPHINITRRSKPGAIPPWGGAPYWRASRRKRKRRWASSGPIPKRLKIRCWTSIRNHRMEVQQRIFNLLGIGPEEAQRRTRSYDWARTVK